MSEGDVTKILVRLSRIEEKLDARGDHERRIRRLEVFHSLQWAIVIIVAGKVLGLTLAGLGS